jgi:hypothetical protein
MPICSKRLTYILLFCSNNSLNIYPKKSHKTFLDFVDPFSQLYILHFCDERKLPGTLTRKQQKVVPVFHTCVVPLDINKQVRPSATSVFSMEPAGQVGAKQTAKGEYELGYEKPTGNCRQHFTNLGV